ncbi:MAG: DUF4167 domain-containing protein [Alphaproteobacteria bacterium]|nr:DUF4167 domain-containing protein [Alphaproteobacteria bacterium]
MRNNRNNGRFNNNFRRHNNHNNNHNHNNSPQVNRNTMFDSNGPSGKIRGTAFQLYEKYDKTAKDFVSQGDDIVGEICSQYADHFFRVHLSTMPAERESAERGDSQQPEESAGSDQHQRPSRSQRAAMHNNKREAVVDNEPPASQITTEFTVPNVEQMDLSIPIAVMASDNQKADEFKQRGRGRPRKVQLEAGE